MADAAHGRYRVDDHGGRWWRRGPLDGRPLLILGHGAGAPLTSPGLVAVRDGLLARGLAVASFHFPYMQAMADGATRRPPDPRPRLLASWRAVTSLARRWPGAGPLVLAGRSMGGRMASHVLAEGHDEGVAGAVYLGFPLHPAGRPGTERAAHLGAVAVPQLFVSGSRDGLARLDLLRSTVASLGPTARLLVVEGADHGLARGRREPLAHGGVWLDEVADFCRRVARA